MDHPVGERGEGHAERERAEQPEGQQRSRRAPAAEPARGAARRAPGPLRHAAAPAERGSPPGRDAEHDEHQRERARRHGVEAELELGEDLDREGAVLDDFKGSVLGEQGQRHEQAAAEHAPGGSGAAVTLRKVRHGPMPRLRAASSRFRRLRERGDGQVDERVERQRHDHHRGAVAV